MDTIKVIAMAFFFYALFTFLQALYMRPSLFRSSPSSSSSRIRIPDIPSSSVPPPPSPASPAAGEPPASPEDSKADAEQREILAQMKQGDAVLRLLSDALLAEKNEEWSKSKSILDNAIESADETNQWLPDLFSARGYSLFQLKNYKSAIADISTAMQLRIARKEAVPANDYLTRAMAFEELKLDASAIKDYKEVRRLQPEWLSAKESLEYLEGGRCKAKKAPEGEEDDDDDGGGEDEQAATPQPPIKDEA